MEEKNFEDLKYLISYPEGFREDKKYPLVLFLHGAGTRNDIEKLKKNKAYLQLRAWQDAKGYILLAPHCIKGDWYAWMYLLMRLVEEVRELPYVDETRIHITGNSMGGYGSWSLTTLIHDWVASAMPICGGGIGGFAKYLVDVPIRTFHGLCDEVVDPVASLEMVKAVNKKGGHAELILFPHLPHNCWMAAYENERNIDWLLSFTTQRDKSLIEELSGDYYG